MASVYTHGKKRERNNSKEAVLACLPEPANVDGVGGEKMPMTEKKNDNFSR